MPLRKCACECLIPGLRPRFGANRFTRRRNSPSHTLSPLQVEAATFAARTAPLWIAKCCHLALLGNAVFNLHQTMPIEDCAPEQSRGSSPSPIFFSSWPAPRRFNATLNHGGPMAITSYEYEGPSFEITSKPRKGFPSETRVKKGFRAVHGDKELREKLGRNDPCPCGSGRSFQEMLHANRPL